MSVASRTMRTLFLFLAIPIGASICCSSALAQAEKQRVVVLKNGQLLEGKIVHEAGKYSIFTEQGSRLVLDDSQVDFTCPDRIEAYWQKNARLKATDIAGHQQLFYWCLKYKLLAQAQNQIDIISVLPIKATQLDYLNRQVVVELEMKEKRQIEGMAYSFRPLPSLSEFDSTLPAHDSIDEKTDSKTKSMGFEPVDSQIAQVGFSEPIKTDAESMSTGKNSQRTRKRPTIHQLDKLTKSLPKPAVAAFKRKIEPLIVRSCFAGGCHHAKDQVMPLIRVGSGRLIPRRMSQRNLDSILRYADPNQPLASPLLTAATTAHGGQDDPIVRPGTVQFENLATWLIMVSNKPYSFHEMPKRDFATSPELSAPIPDVEPQRPAPIADSQPIPAQAKPRQRELIDELKDIATEDPRDPAIFNKMFGRKRK